MKNIVILISGGGSNMAAIVRTAQQQDWAGRHGIRVAAVLSNKADAKGLALARDALVSRDRHFDEIRSSTLPESLDVYLPGRQAWHDVHDGMQDTLRAERQPDVSSGGLVLSPACNQTAIFDTGITLGRRFSPPPSPPFIRRSKD